jgi:hypothetical protein
MKNIKLKKSKDQIDLLEHRLNDLRSYYINEPTIQYKVGDKVIRGNIKETIITEIIDNGKIYKVHEICTNNNYGRPFDSERDDYVIWHDIIPYIDRTKESFIQNEDLNIRYSQRDITSLLILYCNAGVDSDADYQRGNVWNLSDKQSLIDSIFKHIDIGKFTLIRRVWKCKTKLYEILDGKQRLNAIIEFYENRFEYNGKKFYDLSIRDQNHFQNYSVSYGELSSDIKEITNEQKYRYFLKLNTGGKLQDPKHIKYVEELLSHEK